MELILEKNGFSGSLPLLLEFSLELGDHRTSHLQRFLGDAFKHVQRAQQTLGEQQRPSQLPARIVSLLFWGGFEGVWIDFTEAFDNLKKISLEIPVRVAERPTPELSVVTQVLSADRFAKARLAEFLKNTHLFLPSISKV